MEGERTEEILQAIDGFLEQTRRGESVSVEDYVKGHPEIADQLRQHLFTVNRLELIVDGDTRRSRSQNSEETQVDRAASVGQAIGRYRVERFLGAGGMSEVYLATDLELERQVALKIPHVGSSPELLQRMAREAYAMARVSHPHVCRVLDYCDEGDLRFITMDYIDGITLADALAEGRQYTNSEAAGLVATIARAVQAAHSAGVIHRDLKPSNIMLSNGDMPMVMDFGLARSLHRDDPGLTHTGALLGSPAYMAPEQVTAKFGPVGPPTDVYALGVILYQVLAGRKPFLGTSYEIMKKIEGEHPAAPSHYRATVDPRLENICLKAMAKQPEERFAGPLELAQALEGFESLPGRQSSKFVDAKLTWGRTAVAALLVFLIAGLSSIALLIPDRNRNEHNSDAGFVVPLPTPYAVPNRFPTAASEGHFELAARLPTLATSVELVDVDSDGDLDLLLANVDTTQVSIWFNDGSGAFSCSQTLRCESRPNYLSVSDVDQDGHADFYVSTDQSGELYLNSKGSFTKSKQVFLYVDSGPAEFADLDADGLVDMYLPMRALDQADVILLNQGGGQFSDLGWRIEAAPTSSVALGDYNADGRIDVYRATNNQPDDLWFNQGDGAFSLGEQRFLIAEYSSLAEAVDFDRDGSLDVVICSDRGIERGDQEVPPPGCKIWLNDGQGNFRIQDLVKAGKSVTKLAVADFNGDRVLDFWAARGLRAWFGNRPRQDAVILRDFVSGDNKVGENSVTYYGSDMALDVAAGDLDADGDLDVIIANDDSPVTIWSNGHHSNSQPMRPTFVATPQSLGDRTVTSNAIELVDVDGDQDLDAFVSNWQYPNELWLNQGNGLFELSSEDFTVFGKAGELSRAGNLAVSVADVNGDARPDLIGTGISLPITVWGNNGQGKFKRMEQVFVGSERDAPARMQIEPGDFNGDGLRDYFVVVNDYSNEVWLNQGDGHFEKTGQQFGTQIGQVGTAIDWEQDGDLDVLVGISRQGSGIQAWLNDGKGHFSKGPVVNSVTWTTHMKSESGLPVWASAICSADFNGDGLLDLISSCGPYSSSVWLAESPGVWVDSKQQINVDGSEDLIAADFDLDGDVDLLFGNSSDEPMVLAKNDGQGRFEETELFHKTEGCLRMAAGDLDRDGDLDVILANNGPNQVWLNQTIP